MGLGRTAEVFAWDAGLVIKLLRPGFDVEGLRLEEHSTRAAGSAGAPAPRVDGIVEVDGRPGLVLEAVGSSSVLSEILARPWWVRHWGRLIARTHADILTCRPEGLEPVKERLGSAIRRAPVDPVARDRALALLSNLPEGESLLHGDLHPDNVFTDSGTVRVIDWVDATVGHPGADIARTLWLMSPSALPEDLPRRRLAAAFVSRLARSYTAHVLAATGLEAHDVVAWRMPVLVARAAEAIPHEQAALAEAIAGWGADGPSAT